MVQSVKARPLSAPSARAEQEDCRLHPGPMPEAEPDAPFKPASPEDVVRFEIEIRERRVVQEMNLDVFLERVGVHRRGDRVFWTLGIVRMVLGRLATRELIIRSIHMLEDEDKVAIGEAIAADIEKSGYRPR